MELCAELATASQRETRRSRALLVPVKVPIMFGFLATEVYQRELADRLGISSSFLNFAIPAVWHSLIYMTPVTPWFKHSINVHCHNL